MWAIVWFLSGFITTLIRLYYGLKKEDDELETEMFFKVLGFGTLGGFLTAFIGICYVIFNSLFTFEDDVVKIKKHKKKERIDPALFDGGEKVYNNINERVQEKLKEFKS